MPKLVRRGCSLFILWKESHEKEESRDQETVPRKGMRGRRKGGAEHVEAAGD
jgi:hypothetical protein